MQYSRLVLEHFFNPRNVGSLVCDDSTGIARLGTERNGDLVEIAVKIAGNKIVAAKFKAQASCPTIAVCSLLTECILNKSLEEVSQISAQELITRLELPNTKLHCILLVVDVLSAAIENFQAKNP